MVTKVEVRVIPHGRGHRLELYHEDVHIGEYERSMVADDSNDREAKVREAEGAADLLLEARKHTTNGKIAVRFNKPAYRKEIRMYAEGRKDPGRGEPVIALIPKPYWRRP